MFKWFGIGYAVFAALVMAADFYWCDGGYTCHGRVPHSADVIFEWPYVASGMGAAVSLMMFVLHWASTHSRRQDDFAMQAPTLPRFADAEVESM